MVWLKFSDAAAYLAFKFNSPANEKNDRAIEFFGENSLQSGKIDDARFKRTMQAFEEFEPKLHASRDWLFGATRWVGRYASERSALKTKKAYLEGLPFLAMLRGESRIIKTHVFAPPGSYFLDSPFSLAVFKTADKERKTPLARIAFNLEHVNGKLHFVLMGVQGRSASVKDIFSSLPESHRFYGLDWRTAVVLALEEMCKSKGIPFAALTPRANPGLKKVVDLQTKREKQQIRTREMGYHHQSYRNAGLKQVGRYYLRLK